MASTSPPGMSFAFVDNLDETGGARSHVMREHWKQRRQAKHEKKRRAESARQQTRPILPNDIPRVPQIPLEDMATRSSSASTPPTERQGIPTQALAGMNRALGCGRLDPFDMFPVKLTAQCHKLLHHCELPKPSCCYALPTRSLVRVN